MGIRYDPKVEAEIKETANVARDTGSTYKQTESARNDQRRHERDEAKEKSRNEKGRC